MAGGVDAKRGARCTQPLDLPGFELAPGQGGEFFVCEKQWCHDGVRHLDAIYPLFMAGEVMRALIEQLQP